MMKIEHFRVRPVSAKQFLVWPLSHWYHIFSQNAVWLINSRFQRKSCGCFVRMCAVPMEMMQHGTVGLCIKHPAVLNQVERAARCTYLAKALAAFLAWTSLLMRMVSRLTGLGMKPTTPSSFTGRPIHHSLLNFWKFKTDTSRLK